MIFNKQLAYDLYFSMLRIRRIEERIAEEYSKQEMRCPVHLSIGQEAIAVGTLIHSTEEDFLYSNHRSHGHYLAKNGNLNSMIAELYLRIDGCCRGRGGSMHLNDPSKNIIASIPIVSSAIPIAAGSAWGNKLLNRDNIVFVFLGDAATEEGVFFETLNFAALMKLPILFICENNFYSVYSNLEVRVPVNRNLVEIVKNSGVEAESTTFGNDIEAVYASVKKAIEYIKGNNGPYFLEFLTYRHREHCGPNIDDNLGYRPEAEIKKWINEDPILKFKEKLEILRILDSNVIIKMEDSIKEEINDAFNFGKNSEFPSSNGLLSTLYSD